MKKKSKLTSKKLIIILTSFFVVCGIALGALFVIRNYEKEVASEGKYEYYNPDETKADTDDGFKIDGVLDEAVYQNCKWLYARNKNGDAIVDLAMTSYYGDKGMYYVYDVTETTSIYVNTNRSHYLNSGIEMYMVPDEATKFNYNHTFMMNLLPNGEVGVYRSNGEGGFYSGQTKEEYMPYLGATTKGGDVNSTDCHGYCLELFIPWEWFETQGSSLEEVKSNYMYINPAHITSYNEEGTDLNGDRYWYSFATQLGGDGWSNVQKYFKFGEAGLLDSVPIIFESGEHCTITGSKTVIPGMKAYVTLTPDDGYALNSILVNGEERIKKVSYNEDGSVTIEVKSKGEKITVSCAAEKITDGNKTLRGTVYAHKIGGDSLKGLEISYKGPNGELPITLDKNGAFELNDLKQGYYTIVVSKEGYQKLIHGISLKRDIDVELWLEYNLFTQTEGTCWDIDEQNDGVLNSIGGFGVVLTNDAYTKFSIDANFKFDEEVQKQSSQSYYEEQRSGIRIKFSNGKYWHIDMLQQDGVYSLQYAKLTEDNSIYTWTGIHTMNEKEIAKYKSSSGINLKIVRDGQYANVYLDNKFVAAEDLGADYKDLTAQIGFESYAATNGIGVLKFDIDTKNVSVEKKPYFSRENGWDISKQNQGVVTLPGGGYNGSLKFTQQYTDMDLSLTARNYAEGVDGKSDSPRIDVKFVFDNDTCVTFGVLQSSADGDVIIQSMGEKNSLTNWRQQYKFTDEEKALFKSEAGISFRVVRIGTEFAIYVNRNIVKVCDFEGKIKEDTKATIYLRHWGDAGVDVEIPFSMSTKLNKVTITDAGSKNGKVVGQKKTYLVGDTVVLVGESKNYYCNSMLVDGKQMSMNDDTTCSFVATKNSYTVEGKFVKKIFDTNLSWNLLKQNEGMIALPNGGYNATLKFYEKYTDMDLTLTARNYAEGVDGKSDSPRTDVKFEFDNDTCVTFGVLQSSADGDVIIQSMGEKNSLTNWRQQYKFTEEEKALFKSEAGISFRVVRIGTEFAIYVNGNIVKVCDFEGKIKEDTKAAIYLRHWGDAGVDVEIPFSMKDTFDKVKLTYVKNEYGEVAGVKKTYLVGDTVTLQGNGKDGYVCVAVQVDGKKYTPNMDGNFTFVADKKEYTIEAEFARSIFTDGSGWNITKQYEGLVILPNGGDNFKLCTSDTYGNVDLTMTVRNYKDGKDSAKDSPRTAAKFDFTDGKCVVFSILNQPQTGNVYIQTMGESNSLISWTAPYTFTTAEKELFESEEGITFRIVRAGTVFTLYINGEQKYQIDLSAKGLKAETEASINIRHWGDSGVNVELPFSIKKPVVFEGLEEGKGKVSVEPSVCFAGDTVKLKVEADRGYICDGVKVNGKPLTVNNDGTYSLTLVEDTYVVEAAYKVDENAKYKYFATADGWDLSKQHEGVVTLKNGGNNYNLHTIDQYTDVDMTITVKEDMRAGAENRRTDVLFKFANNKHLSLSIIANSSGGYIQSMQVSNSITGNWAVHWTMTAEELAAYRSEAGLEFRVRREGTKFKLYIGDQLRNTLDFAGKIESTTEAYIYIRNFGTTGADVEIPFSFGNKYFATADGWDLSKQQEGIVTLKNGGYNANLRTIDKYKNVDLTLTVRNYAEVADVNDSPRTAVKFNFTNGKCVIFSVLNQPQTGKVYIQTMGENNSLIGWTAPYTFTDDEKALFESKEGIEFRIVRTGTVFSLYINGEKKYQKDFSGNGLTTNVEAEINIRHWGDSGVDIEMPFLIKEVKTKSAVSRTTSWFNSIGTMIMSIFD